MKRDERIVRLAENVVNYSVGVQKGERIYVECFGASAQPLFEEVIAAVTRAGGVPFYYCNDNAFIRDFLRSADEAQIKAYRKSWEIRDILRLRFCDIFMAVICISIQQKKFRVFRLPGLAIHWKMGPAGQRSGSCRNS